MAFIRFKSVINYSLKIRPPRWAFFPAPHLLEMTANTVYFSKLFYLFIYIFDAYANLYYYYFMETLLCYSYPWNLLFSFNHALWNIFPCQHTTHSFLVLHSNFLLSGYSLSLSESLVAKLCRKAKIGHNRKYPLINWPLTKLVST